QYGVSCDLAWAPRIKYSRIFLSGLQYGVSGFWIRRIDQYGLVLGIRSIDQYGVLVLQIWSIEVLDMNQEMVLSSSKYLDTACSSRMIRFSSGIVPDPQDPERNIQLAGMGLPFTSPDEGIRKSQTLPEGTTADPKDSGGNVQSADKGLPSTASDEWTSVKYQVDKTHSTRLRYQTLTENKGKTSSKVESNHETLQLTTLVDFQAYLLSKDELAQESDEKEVFATGDHMEEDSQANEEEDESISPKKDKPEPSHTPETQKGSWSNISGRSLEFFLRKLLKNNGHNIKKLLCLMLTLRPPLKANEENVDHREQTDKVINAAMNSLDKNNIARGDLLNSLNGVTETLKAIQDVVKEDLVLNKKVIKATEAYIKNSTHLTELLTLIKNFDF
ncbi:hypothetical protein Tco_0717426, partial [Tanacetum coccineum]